MTEPPRASLAELVIADAPGAWAALGFTITDGTIELDGVRLRLGAGGSGIVAWSLAGISRTDAIDGLPTTPLPAAAAALMPPVETEHANGAVGLDHVVITTPAFDRTAAALDDVGLGLRRIRTVGSGEKAFRQGFRRIGPAILELVELAGQSTAGPSRFWGLVINVSDLDALAEQLGPERVSPAKAAVQPGRRIATLRPTEGITPAVAFMTPE